ncbi:MAG: CoA transferase [Gammaproteobacteria bacterium]|nr:CoA transferase [Gammaproteobacteria bacterium]
MTDATTRRPLDGIRVLELGQLIAGPFAGTLLAYFGAEVIKIEPPGSGDALRGWRVLDQGTSYWWFSQGRNKKSVTVNLRDREGQDIVRSLAATADVLVENFKPGQMEHWGLGPEQLKAINPALIYTRVSGYGQTGPDSGLPGFASVCEGFGGFRYLNGFPGEPPVRPNLSLGDTLAGLHAAFGVLLALVDRLRGGNGQGQVVDVAIYESIFNMMESVLPEFSGAGLVREPSGSTLTGIVPSNTYRCGDGKLIIIGANTDSMYQRLMNLIRRPDLANDPECAHNSGRVKAQARIDGAIGEWTCTLRSDEAIAALRGAGIAAGPIYSIADIAADPHYAARGMFETVTVNDHELTIPAMAPQLAATPGRTDWPGPRLGEHTDAVLGSTLGFDDSRMTELRSRGII